MSHLTDEQLEEILMLGREEPEHVAVCPACRQRLAEKQALRDRLCLAFDRIHAPVGLAARIKSRCVPSGGVTAANPSLPVGQGLRLRWPTRLLWPAMAAAVMIGVLSLFYFTGSSMENSAQAELVQVHRSNLSSTPELFTDKDPAKLASYLHSQVGFTPRVPGPVKGVTLRGCCVRPYCRRLAASYVLDTPGGVVSIIVIPNHPQSLGMKQQAMCAKCKQCTCWRKNLNDVNLAAIRQGEYSYYAVGHIAQAKLTELLMAVYPSPGQ